MNENSNFGSVALSVIAIVIAVLSLGYAVSHVGVSQVAEVQPAAGGITIGTNYKYGISVGNTATLGTVPTNFSKILVNTCSLISNSFTVAATTSTAMDCAVTGVVSTDIVFAEFASSSVATAFGPGWSVSGAAASSTAGFITLTVYNGTGVSGVIPASMASTTRYQVFGTQ